MGEHSPEASAFAFEAIVAAAFHGTSSPELARDSLGLIAASYAPEMLAGSRWSNARGRESSMVAPKTYSRIPGLSPSFHLSPLTTRRFFASFGHSNNHAEPFDAAMDLMYDDLVRATIPEDMENRTLGALGELAGIQFLGQRDARQSLDDMERDLATWIQIATGIPVPSGGRIAHTWSAIRWGGSSVVAAGNGSQDRVALLETDTGRALLTQEYEYVRLLLEFRPELAEPLPPELRSESGELLESSALIANPDLALAYSDWVDGHSIDDDSDNLDDLADTAGFLFLGGFQRVQQGDDWRSVKP